VLATCVVAALAGAAIGCGSDSNDTSSGSGSSSGSSTAAASSSSSGSTTSSASGAKAPSGKPIVFGTILPVNSPIYSLPDAVAMAKVAEKAINASGGINGRPIQVETCDDKNNPNTNTECAKKLVGAGAVALIADNSYAQGSTWPVVEKAGVAMFGNAPSSPQDFTSKVSFPGSAGIAVYSPVVAALPPNAKNVVFFSSGGPAAKALYGYAQPGFKSKGIKSSFVEVAPTAVDYGPTVLAIQKNKPDAIVGGTSVNIVLQAMQKSGQLGYKTPWVVGQGAWNQKFLDTAKKYGIPIYGSLLFDQDPKNQVRAQLQDEVKKYGDGSIKEPNADAATNTWLFIHQAAKLAGQLPADGVTPKAFMDLLNSGVSVDTGLTPPISYKGTGPIKGFPRLFNTSAKPAKYDFATGQWVEQPEWAEGAKYINGEA